ncbi:MAG: hypothetical protein JST75_09305 [Bacteroidetes bacterium]|nr:hypothetical protein [Bacteroidota bacterium]
MTPEQMANAKEGLFKSEDTDAIHIQIKIQDDWYLIGMNDLDDIAINSGEVTAKRIEDWFARDYRKRLPADFQAIKNILIEAHVDLERYHARHLLTAEEIGWRKAEKEDDARTILKWFSDDYNITFKEIQHYQFRMEKNQEKVDIFPQTKKYHDITNNQRGRYRNLSDFLVAYFKINAKS